MRIAAIITLFVSITLSATVVRAESPTCVTGSPGSPACTEPVQPVAVPVGWQPVAPAQPAPARDLSEVTHSFYMPTGNLTPAGEYSYSVHELGLFNTVRVGLSDRVELSAGAPGVPIVWSAGARLSLTSRDSPFRAVVGGSVWMPLVQESEAGLSYAAQGTLTVGYQTRDWNIHGSLSTLRPSFDDDALVSGSAGIVYRVGRKWAVMADISTLSVATASTCSDGCIDNDFPVRFLTAGIKYMGNNVDMDFGVFAPIVDEGEGTRVWLLPMVSFHRH